MDVVGHTIDDNGFLLFALDDASNVFVQLVFPLFTNEVLSSVHSKHDLDVDLRECAGHVLPMRLYVFEQVDVLHAYFTPLGFHHAIVLLVL